MQKKIKRKTWRHKIYNYQDLQFLGDDRNYGNVILFLTTVERFLESKLEFEVTENYLKIQGEIPKQNKNGSQEYWSSLKEVPGSLEITELTLNYLNCFFGSENFIKLTNFKIWLPLFSPRSCFFGCLLNHSINKMGIYTLSKEKLTNRSQNLKTEYLGFNFLSQGKFFNGTQIIFNRDKSDLSQLFNLEK